MDFFVWSALSASCWKKPLIFFSVRKVEKGVTVYIIISRPKKKVWINKPCGESTKKIILLYEYLHYYNLHSVLREITRRAM